MHGPVGPGGPGRWVRRVFGFRNERRTPATRPSTWRPWAWRSGSRGAPRRALELASRAVDLVGGARDVKTRVVTLYNLAARLLMDADRMEEAASVAQTGRRLMEEHASCGPCSCRNRAPHPADRDRLDPGDFLAGRDRPITAEVRAGGSKECPGLTPWARAAPFGPRRGALCSPPRTRPQFGRRCCGTGRWEGLPRMGPPVIER